LIILFVDLTIVVAIWRWSFTSVVVISDMQRGRLERSSQVSAGIITPWVSSYLVSRACGSAFPAAALAA